MVTIEFITRLFDKNKKEGRFQQSTVKQLPRCSSGVSASLHFKRFVGVMANITDCRSVATGSIPVRTAKNIGVFQLVESVIWNHGLSVRA